MGTRRSLELPNASTESALGELHEPSIRVAEVGGATPGVVSRLDQKSEACGYRLGAHACEIVDPEGEVIFVRRSSGLLTRSLMDEEGPVADGELRATRPARFGLSAEQPPVEARDAVDVVGEECYLAEHAHVAISNSRSTSLSDVLRSVEALREPTMSAHGNS